MVLRIAIIMALKLAIWYWNFPLSVLYRPFYIFVVAAVHSIHIKKTKKQKKQQQQQQLPLIN